MSKRMSRDEFLSYLRDGAEGLALPYAEQFDRYGQTEFTTEALLEVWDDGVAYLRYVDGLTERQRQLIDFIEGTLELIDAPADEFWQNRGLSSDVRWDLIRGAARALLMEFGWDRP